MQWLEFEHLSALLIAVGFVPTEPTPEPACAPCGDAGTVEKHRSRWIGGGRTGYRDEWTVTETCTACRSDVAA